MMTMLMGLAYIFDLILSLLPAFVFAIVLPIVELFPLLHEYLIKFLKILS